MQDQRLLWLKSFNPCFNGSMYKNPNLSIEERMERACFNPCFNGSMYKNTHELIMRFSSSSVSILVLMDLCIKTSITLNLKKQKQEVSILVLMDLCIKTDIEYADGKTGKCFNPCFNGSIYKNFPASNTKLETMQFQSLF